MKDLSENVYKSLFPVNDVESFYSNGIRRIEVQLNSNKSARAVFGENTVDEEEVHRAFGGCLPVATLQPNV
ncbi:hypothetical protein HM131_00110 [Halobacillus mangrovi]|uniref:Uncharacterized protein n=1 Tax=Halobacillus mangrovi TaxID=402384 RepID=A0A1W5ZPY9_9BACI|nr:hypothetical protein HM131_00110 [Halobacillus mangrovi]